MNDPTRTDLGFNFTYRVDIFPAKPWVFSAVLDAGTLGKAGLFRFRTTAEWSIGRSSSIPVTSTPTSAPCIGTG